MNYQRDGKQIFSFFLGNICKQKFSLFELQHEVCFKHHEFYQRVVKILRLKSGSEIIIFDDYAAWLVEIVEIESDSILIKTKEKIALVQKKTVNLYLGLLRKSSFEAAVYSSAAAGVSKIIPVISAKIEKNWWSERELSRLQKIIIGAREQSKNFNPVMLTSPIFIDKLSINDCVILCDPQGQSFFDHSLQENFKNHDVISVIVGPEGGFTTQEINDLTLVNQVVKMSLVKNILRGEDAAFLAAGLFLLN